MSEASTELTADHLRRLVLDRLGLRIGPEMSEYVLRRLRSGVLDPIPVMGGNARTGAAVRVFIEPAALTAASAH